MKRISILEDNWIENDGYRKQILADSDALRSAGNLVQVVTVKPGDSVEDHYHRSTHEFLYVIQGDVKFSIDGKDRRLKTGDMLVTEPGDRHHVHNDGSEEFKVLVFKTNVVPEDTYYTKAKVEE